VACCPNCPAAAAAAAAAGVGTKLAAVGDNVDDTSVRPVRNSSNWQTGPHNPF